MKGIKKGVACILKVFLVNVMSSCTKVNVYVD